MLTAIFSKVGLGFVEKLIDRGASIFEAYQKKQISMEELRTELLKVTLGIVRDIEVAYAESLTSTFNTFITAARDNAEMTRVWAWVTLSQLFVLVYHQVIIGWITLAVRYWHHGWNYPSSGSTVDWAYALVALCMGGGAIALKMGPGSSSIVDSLKGLVGKAR